jgi:hypothetical protein
MMYFKPIPGYPDYEVSNIGGHVMSFKRNSPRLMRSYFSKQGAECMRMRVHGRSKSHGLGHLVLLAWVGPPPEGHVCIHGKRGHLCHDVDNLHWGSYAEMLATGRRTPWNWGYEPRAWEIESGLCA